MNISTTLTQISAMATGGSVSLVTILIVLAIIALVIFIVRYLRR